ncbi:MAG: sigma 54-interacting transcriptional regulator [Bacillota bacterium]
MYERIAFMSYPRLTRLARAVLDEEIINRVIVHEGAFDQTLSATRRLVEQGLVDVVVSGGSNAQCIKENLRGVPLVTIEISGFDLMEAVCQAVSSLSRVGLVTYRSSMPQLTRYLSLLNRTVTHIEYNDSEDLKEKMTLLKSDGYDGVIGASMVCDLAEELGLASVFIYSHNAIRRAMSHAVDLVETKMRQKMETQQLRTILDFTYSGIVAIDETATVRIFNPTAENITGIPAESVIGCHVRQAISNTRLDRVLKTGVAELNRFQRIKDRLILTNRVPIIVDGRPVGAVATFQPVEEIQRAEQHIRQKLHSKGLVAKTTFDNIAGESETILKAKRIARLYAQEECTVLITGETGTGKEMFAQSIHNESRRRNAPFVAVNCGAIPANLLESELFGYEEGAFTGAKKGGKTGLLELAHRGTVFLDEIGSMPLELQSRLLRVLQEREIMRIGSDRVIPVDIRFIAATNTPLIDRVERGAFREDLYFRLNVFNLDLPPLRERRCDIPVLVESILKAEGKSYLFQKRRAEWDRVFSSLKDYAWPGNIRELYNLVRRICLVMENDLDLDEAVVRLLEQGRPASASPGDADQSLVAVLNRVGWNRSRAAEVLGISRTTLWRKMREAGLGRMTGV